MSYETGGCRHCARQRAPTFRRCPSAHCCPSTGPNNWGSASVVYRGTMDGVPEVPGRRTLRKALARCSSLCCLCSRLGIAHHRINPRNVPAEAGCKQGSRSPGGRQAAHSSATRAVPWSIETLDRKGLTKKPPLALPAPTNLPYVGRNRLKTRNTFGLTFRCRTCVCSRCSS